jgi:hypothetical protein
MGTIGARGWIQKYHEASVLGAFVRKWAISFAMSVRPSVRMEQLGSHWTGFHEIWDLYIYIFKSVKKTQILLQRDQNNGQFTRRPMYIYDNISMNSS